MTDIEHKVENLFVMLKECCLLLKDLSHRVIRLRVLADRFEKRKIYLNKVRKKREQKRAFLERKAKI